MGIGMSFLYKNDCVEQSGSPVITPSTPLPDYGKLAEALVRSIIYEKNQYRDLGFSNPECVTQYLLADYEKLDSAILNRRYEHSDEELFRREAVPSDYHPIAYALTCLKQTLLTLAARYSSSEVFCRLLQHPEIDPNVANDEGDTPLHIATNLGRMNIVGVLVNDPRTDISKKDADGKSARRLSRIHNFAEIEEIIMKAESEQNRPKF